MNQMILTNETDIYAFFEIIDRTEARSILDVGMFLKRIGGVSRQVKEKEISPDKELIGVDFFPETACPVWNTIYDKIYRPNEIFLPDNHQEYELAVVLQLEKCMDEAESFSMWAWLSAHVSYILTDWRSDEVKKMTGFKAVREITVDNKSYWFITL